MTSRSMRSGMLRALLAGAAAAALSLTGAVSAIAEEPLTTTITGTVTREADGLPVAGVHVFVNSTDLSKNGFASTDADGEYTVSGLEPGEYVVRFATETTGTGLISEYWNAASEWSSAQRITAVGGDTIADIDASLQQGGAIAGRVTRESDGTPLAGVTVSAAGANPGSPGMASTDAEGNYRIDGLVPGDYRVHFDAPDAALVDEYWQAAYDAASATGVAVVADEIDTGADASLIVGATISGTLTSAIDGSPVAGSVQLTSSTGSWVAGVAPDGSYSAVVAPGEYTVKFTPYGHVFQAEYWKDAATEEEATPVVAVAGQSVSGIDAQVDQPVAIAGRVTSGGEPLVDAIVEAWQGGEVVGMAYTGETGEYRLLVPPGEYVVSVFGLAYDPIYAREYFDGARTPADSTPVVLGLDADRGGVDFDLDLGGVLRGSVTAAEGSLPTEGVVVTALLRSGDGWSPVASVLTTGAYVFGADDPEAGHVLPPLPAGTYTIAVAADGFCTQFLGGGATPDEAETLELAEGGQIAGVDVTLAADCPEPLPVISLSSGSVKAGGDIEIVGEHFAPGETVAFELHSDPIALGSLTADREGRLEGALRIPATVPPGSHSLVALGVDSTVQATATLEITAAGSGGSGSGGSGAGGSGGGVVGGKTGTAPGGLASTGAEAPSIALLGGILLAAAGLVLVRRRRAAR